MKAIIYTVYLSMAIAGILLVLWRLWRGPSNADRLNAADLLTVMGLGILLASSIGEPHRYTLDVALAGSLLLFFGSSLVALVWRPDQLQGESIDDDS